MIKIKGLNKYYNKNKQSEIHALDNIDLNLPEKGMIAIFGKSGCGKTTLLNVIGGLDKAQKGSIEIDGESITSQTDSLRNKYIGYIFQNYNLNPQETCFENVANALRLCGMKDEDLIERRVIAALKNVGMEKYKKRTPDTLSGGQMQRIAIARAIVKNPKIILADEPTGNLDSDNTVMIMDLLKEISRDHLVLIVTHEQSLVDLYCDRVIQISDGRIIKIYDNESTKGYTEKPKNNVYLGELQKKDLSNEYFNIEYYGNDPENKLDIKIINHEGRILIRFEDPGKFKIIDESSETKLIDGVFESSDQVNNDQRRPIDMSELPSFKGKSFGKLFSFKESIISGYKNNFKNRKKKKTLLYLCMWLFSISLVFAVSYFGISIKNINDTRDKVSDDIFYVKATNEKVSELLFSAIGSQGITDITFAQINPIENNSFFLDRVKFESEKYNFNMGEAIPAAHLKLGSSEGKELICGKNTEISEDEIMISSKLADIILEASTVGYIQKYEDILGMKNTEGFRIVGIVSSDNSEVYYNPYTLAKQSYSKNLYYTIVNDKDIGLDAPKNEVVVFLNEINGSFTKKSIKLGGVEYKITAIITSSSYKEWCELCKKEMYLDEYEYYKSLILKEHTGIQVNTEQFYDLLRVYEDERYFDFLEQYYAYMGEFLKDISICTSTFSSWLYNEKGVEDAKYIAINDPLYYCAALHKQNTGSYPTRSEMRSEIDTAQRLEELINDLYVYKKEYDETLFYKYYNNYSLILNSEDYLLNAHRYGETTDPYDNEYDVYYSYDPYSYYAISSRDIELTENYLHSTISGLFSEDEEPEDYYYYERLENIYTPDMILEEIISRSKATIISNLISLLVYIILLSVCILLIMRSSVMMRIKEIGIYRAVGVTKKNMIFKFATEAFVLTSGTVLPGFLISSTLIWLWINENMLIKELFYYPVHFALVLLVFIYVIGIVAGILPVITLLRKTPSQILSKYDI